MAEGIEEGDDGEFAAYPGAEDEEEPSNISDPAHCCDEDMQQKMLTPFGKETMNGKVSRRTCQRNGPRNMTRTPRQRQPRKQQSSSAWFDYSRHLDQIAARIHILAPSSPSRVQLLPCSLRKARSKGKEKAKASILYVLLISR